MVGTQKWSMEEILWVTSMANRGLKDDEIYESFGGIFKKASHVRGPSSIKYCRTGFMKQEEYSQERYWEDVPGKIGFVVGRHDAGVIGSQIVSEVAQYFPTHRWVPYVKPAARCVEFVVTKYGKLQGRFSSYSEGNPLIEPVLRFTREGFSPERILHTANENGINLDDIYYVVARFGLQANSGSAGQNSNNGQRPEGSSKGKKLSERAPGNSKVAPLVLGLPSTEQSKENTFYGSQRNRQPPSHTRSQLSHGGPGFEYAGRASNQLPMQPNFDMSLFNHGCSQGLSSETSSLAQLHSIQPRTPVDPSALPYQYGAAFPFENLPGNDQMQQQTTNEQFFLEYTGGNQIPLIGQAIPGQLSRSAPPIQQRTVEPPQGSFQEYQQAPTDHGLPGYGSSAQTMQFSYWPRINQRQMHSTPLDPQNTQARVQQPSISLGSHYENIDPGILEIDMMQNSSYLDMGDADLSQYNSSLDAGSSSKETEDINNVSETGMAGPFLAHNSAWELDPGNFAYRNAGIFEDDYAHGGTCCIAHQNFECYFGSGN